MKAWRTQKAQKIVKAAFETQNQKTIDAGNRPLERPSRWGGIARQVSGMVKLNSVVPPLLKALMARSPHIKQPTAV